MFWIILLSVVLVPLSSAIKYGAPEVWYCQWVTLFAFCFFAVSALMWKTNKYLAILLAYCTISSLFLLSQEQRSVMTLVQIALAMLLIKFISELSLKERRWIVYALFFVTLIQGVWVFLQMHNIDPIFSKVSLNPSYGYLIDKSKDDMVGFTGSSNQLGLFLATTLPVVAYVCIWLVPIFVFLLFISKTTTTVIAAFVGFSIYMFFVHKKLFTIFIILSIVFLSVFFTRFEKQLSSTVISERVKIWNMTIAAVFNKEILINKKEKTLLIQTYNSFVGYGLATFYRVATYAQQQRSIMMTNKNIFMHLYSHAHNDFIEAFFELGIIGLLILLTAIGNLVYRFVKAIKTKELILYFSCIVIFLLSACGIFAVHVAASGYLLVIFLGLFEGEINDGEYTVLA